MTFFQIPVRKTSGKNSHWNEENTVKMIQSLMVRPQHSLGYLHMLPQVLSHLFGQSAALKAVKKCRNAHFSAYCAEYLGPLVAD